MSTKRAFTLIELLLVVSIIALLIAILLPSLQLSKGHADVARCLANHRTLAAGWYSYAVSNSSKMMGAHTARPSYDWVENVGVPVLPSNEKITDLQRGRMWSYVGAADTYRCPNEPRGFLRSYSINNLVGGTSDWHVRARLSIRGLKRADQTLVFIEEPDPRGYNWGSWVIHPKNHGNSSTWIDWPASFHFNNSCTLSFADGRAELWKWQDPRTPNIKSFYEPAAGNIDLVRLQAVLNPGDLE